MSLPPLATTHDNTVAALTARPYSSKFKYSLAATIAIGIIFGFGPILFGFTALSTQQAVGFAACMVTGGVISLLSMGGILWIVVRHSKLPLEKVYEPQSYSELGGAAIESAKGYLRSSPEISSIWGNENLEGPTNPEITALWNLAEKEWAALVRILRENQTASEIWEVGAVADQMDKCANLHYAISNLTLDDLPQLSDRLISRPLSYSDFMGGTQRTYVYKTMILFSECYHTFIRRGVYWHVQAEDIYLEPPGSAVRRISSAGEWIAGFEEQTERYSSYASLFYQEGTLQYKWRELYNDFLDRLGRYGHHGDFRYAFWLVKDENQIDYRRPTGTLPT